MNVTDMLKKIAARRRELKFTQDEMGKHLGLSASQYSRIESGASKLSAEHLDILTKILKLDLGGEKITLPQQQLPTQQETSVSVDEYIKLTNELVKLHSEIDSLKKELMDQNSLTEIKKSNADIFTFFKLEMDLMKQGYQEEYRPDWTKIAEAAHLPEPSQFLTRFAEYQVYGEPQKKLTKSDLPPPPHQRDELDDVDILVRDTLAGAKAAGLTPFEFLMKGLEEYKATLDAAETPTDSLQKNIG